MKKLLILGAGISQLPLIRAAKRLGLHVVVLSRPGNYPGFALADTVYCEDTTDAERVVDVARLESVDGICTTGTDVAVRSIGKAVDALGLCGVGGESARLSSNKWDMKRAFMEHGIRTARCVKIASREEAVRAFGLLTPPLIFKAVDSGASKGVVKVADASQADYAYGLVMQATRQDFFIVEEFIEGTEFGAQAFVYEGDIRFIMPHGDMMFYGDAGVPIGHYVPYALPPEVERDVRDQLERSVRALKMDNCAVNADLMLRDNRVYVLEIGARAGATCLPELVSTHYGYDYYEQIVRAALRMNPEFPVRTWQPCACELLLADRSGRIETLENGNGEHDDIIQASFDYGVGDKVNRFRVGTDRIGQIVVKGDRLEDALDRLEEVKRNIRIVIT